MKTDDNGLICKANRRGKMSLNILHLSDIHISSNQVPDASALLLGNDFPSGAPDVILITGDLFDHSAFSPGSTRKETKDRKEKSIQNGVLFCNNLITYINDYYDVRLTTDSVLFIPGNHEINRSATNLDEYLENFKLFLDSFYSNNIPNWYSTDFTFVKKFEREKVIIVGFRSPHFNEDAESAKEYDDYGMIESGQLFSIRKRLHSIKDLHEYSIIASLHHQFILMEERDKKYVDKSYLRNSEQFIKFLSEENFSTVLHGHKHTNSNRRLNIELDITKPEKIITVLGCGSLAEDDAENCFNYITVFPRGYKYDIEYSSYKRTRAGYNLDGSSIKLPVDTKKFSPLIMESAISEDPDLKKAYDTLISYDSLTHTEALFHLLNETMFSLSGVAEHINSQKDLLYFVLATAHYRFLINLNAPKSIIDKVDLFIDKKKHEYFHENAIYDEISKISRIKELIIPYRKTIDTLSHSQKAIVVLSSMVTLLTDYYLLIKYRCEDFYNTIVRKKIDFAYSGSSLTSELRGNTIDFVVDDERRSLEISVTCDTAEAIKICSLIVKEFEIILHDFERDFSDFGFRVYYVLPKLKHNGRRTNEIESRQFTAYIPRLLPLLAGRNIYSKPEAFAREVIQNSIDAIKVRKEHDRSFNEPGKISIIFGRDNASHLSYFDIEDNGSGMTKYILERYLTTLGLSYYTGIDYQSLNLQYNPISQFGIGFLSCFMLGKHIEVFTRHYTSPIGYYLDIPNFDGCFFVEEDKTRISIGTKIRIWENPDQKNTEYAFNSKKIKDYIKQYIRNASIDIYVNGEILIPKNHLWAEIESITSIYKIHHFVPIEKDYKTGMWNATEAINCISDNRFGFHLFKRDDSVYSTSKQFALFNDGIFVPGLPNSEKMESICDQYFYISANLPPECLNLDVSRDNLKNFNSNLSFQSVLTAIRDCRSRIANEYSPYYLLQEKYDPERFRDSNLIFRFNKELEEITIYYDANAVSSSNTQGILNLLNYLSGNMYCNEACQISSRCLTNQHLYGDFTQLVFTNMCDILPRIIDVTLKKHISVNAQQKEFDEAILNSLIGRSKPLHEANISTAKSIISNIQKYNQQGNLYNAITALEKNENEYYNRVRKLIKRELTSIFMDRRNTSNDSRRSQAGKDITKALMAPESKTVYLSKFFKSYLKRAYAKLPSNKNVSLFDVAAITISAIYSLLDMASIICSYNELKEGVSFKIKREDLEPTSEWFDSLLKS